MSITNTAGMQNTGRYAFKLSYDALTSPSDFLWAMQFTRLHPKTDTSQFLNIQYLYDFANPDVHWVQYGDISGTFGATSRSSVGAQNFDGSLGVAYTGPIVEGLVLKYYHPMIPPPPLTVTFQVTVNAAAPAIITNTLGYVVDAANTGEMSVNGSQLRVPGPFNSISVVVLPGELPADGNSTAEVTATTVDILGTPVSGVFVNLVTTAGAISPAYGTSDANGVVTGTLTAPSASGVGTVYALAGVKMATAPVTFTQSAATYDLLNGTILTTTPIVAHSYGVITYTFTVSNAGTGDASNVLMVAPIPSNTTYLAGSASGGAPTGVLLANVLRAPLATPDSPAATTGIAWSGNIPAHSSHTVTYAVKTSLVEGVVNNTAHVYVDNTEVGAGDFTATTPVEKYRITLFLVQN